MSRIKKRGLDYFPMNTDFLHDRLVRRIMKREGDASLVVLLQILSGIYAGEGYYVHADNDFCEDLADSLFEKETADVQRIIALSVELGMFDAALYAGQGILTSADIQQQYLFITRRRNQSQINPLYRLLPEDENVAETDIPVTETDINATIKPENTVEPVQSTQSIAKQSIAQQSTEKRSIENLLLNGSPQNGGTHSAGTNPAKDEREEEYSRKIESLCLPQDNVERNYDGLLLNLRQLRISANEQYALILKSNFGAIGHPLWRGFYVLRESHGKIKMPGRYLLSLCGK